MFRRFLLVLLALAAVIGALAYLKYGQIQGQIAMFSQPMPAPVVAVAQVRETRWEPTLDAVGSVQAVQGVEVSNQVAGQVKEIRFDSGANVRQGDILVRLDDDVDQADLEGLQAAERLAALKFKRNSTLLKDRAVSLGDVDDMAAQVDQTRAQVKSKQATIDKKVIRAPFAGQLGIRKIDQGQFLKEGTPIVLLQALDPLYVDYALPEREIGRIQVGQPVRVRVAAQPDETFHGSIAAIAPGVDRGTRSMQVRARFANPKLQLRPGMFARVETVLPVQDRVLTLPREAITFNTYGDSVFLVEGENGKLKVHRRQIATGAVRGDEVTVLSGLKAGDRVVSAGQVKLTNGQEIQIKGAAAQPAPTNPGAKPE
ncbi:efflux RND transporter periplasmic adaptor subunit [uncultured Thiodictyon sp.]|uniref:efflux RND transporter periplasmic adaptor subunit n=1 Tax=uncultured Thiodictyon sp. TaxID=1846217 RepID=UPI00260010EA|nr:efflux RND transporter periplasmic adaptor subunit [uncultured Thiodictyon sp.]